LEVVKALASLGAGLNARMSGGAIPMHGRAEFGHLEIVKALASFGGT
jgi:ankyrin repeat protein